MSGMIPDLASWALRGQDNTTNGEDEGEADNNASGSGETLTPEELRAQRLQRMELSQQQQEHQAQSTPTASSLVGPEPMDVDTTVSASNNSNANKSKLKPAPKKAPPSPSAPAPSPDADSSEKKKKRKADKESDPNRKFERKKEITLRKVLNARAEEFGDEQRINITGQSISEVLAGRVAGSPPPPSASVASAAKSLVAYLADCHRKAAEELKTVRTVSANARKESQQQKDQNEEMTQLLQEVQNQAVNYAASVLIDPDMFPLGTDSSLQLAHCLYTSLSDMTGSITFGVGGSSSNSFYFALVQELITQDESSLERIVKEIVQIYIKAMRNCESVLDNNVVLPGSSTAVVGSVSGLGLGDNSPTALVSAFTALTMHKKVAEIVTQMEEFLLPPVTSSEAEQMVVPPPPPMPTAPPMGANNSGRLLQQFMASLAQQHLPSYKKRSGPALEKSTLLGLCLRVGIPTKNNAAFAPQALLRQSVSAVEVSTRQQRTQLKAYQEVCNQLLHNLVKAGATPRSKVLDWFTDALLVNVGASATRPDPSKVSSSSLLLNMSVSLLKLCEPFVKDPAKHKLIDPKFCSAPQVHKGVYATAGDDAVPRLGEGEENDNNNENDENKDAKIVEYNPKNGFVSQLFFLTARAIHFGMASSLRQHENLLRNLSHLHWMITSRNNGSTNDLHNDPQFAMFVSRQRSAEVALFQEDMVADHLAFLQLVAKVLVEMDDAKDLRDMPEDFVSDVCHVLTSIAKIKGNLLKGTDVTNSFKLVVKLLSPKYAMMVRNYNLRAMLGDVLYELFLPHDNSRDNLESVPESVYTDSRVGETYLLSDTGAQETLAPSLLLLYGEVEHTGYYDRMSHRAKISSLIKYLWESKEHRPAFRRITQNKDSFIKFANGIMNETNTLIATVMQKLPEIREAQIKMKNAQEWNALTEDQQKQISERLEDNEREVKHALPLCNKTLQMFGYLNTDEDIRNLFLLEELCSRLVQMLLHVMTKLVGSKGLELKVENPEELDFKPKVMLRDLCYIFGLFADAIVFQDECAKSGGDPGLLRQALKTVQRLKLLQGDHLKAFERFPAAMEAAANRVAEDEALLTNAPDEFLDALLSTFMKDPVVLPSGHCVDRSTISQHLLNDPIDPFNRQPMTMDDVKPAAELKERMVAWLEEQRALKMSLN